MRRSGIIIFVLSLIALFLAVPTFALGYINLTSGELKSTTPASSSNDFLNPTLLDTNQWNNLSENANPFYSALNIQKPVLLDINKSEYNDYIDMEVYSDDLYQTENKIEALYFSNNDKVLFNLDDDDFVYIKTTSPISGSTPIISSALKPITGESTIVIDQIYSRKLYSNNYSVFYLDMTKNYRYKVNFTRYTNDTDIEFNFVYAADGEITRDYTDFILYNNGEFTATNTTTAIVLLKSYQSGGFEFDFQFSIVSTGEIDDRLTSDQIMLIILGVAGGIYVVYEIIKRIRLQRSELSN